MPFNWKERPVLVTGATGIVGSWLCEALLERNARVIALVLDDDRQSRFYAEGIYKRCSIVRGDLANFADCMRAMNSHEADVVFHLGAQTIVGAALRDPLECFESNIRGTYNLLEAARRLPGLASRVVVASSDKAYGESDVLPYTEEMPLQGSHPYDVSKSCADLLSHTYANTYDLCVTVARCGNIYGAGDLNWSRIVPGTIRSLFLGERPILRSDGTMIRDYIYVRDVISAYILLAERCTEDGVRGEAFNFSTGNKHSVLDILKAIGETMGAAADPIIENSARMEILNQTLDSAKARKQLGWSSEWDLERGLRETLTWYRAFLSRNAIAGR
jgi:CDP-glucose 4,6-dehydratase